MVTRFDIWRYNDANANFSVKTVKRLTTSALFLVLALGLAPNAAFAHSNSQKDQQKEYNKYLKHQQKMQKKQTKEQNKQTKQWNKQHQVQHNVT